jgi:hypothetical protein
MPAHRFLHLARHGEAVDDGDLSPAVPVPGSS